MKLFRISAVKGYHYTAYVIANSMGEAEKLFLKEYSNTTILKIEKHSERIIIQKNK